MIKTTITLTVQNQETNIRESLGKEKMKEIVTIVIPTLNEAQAIGKSYKNS